MDWLINTSLLTYERAGFFISYEEGFYADPYKMPQ